jgi:N-carbamoylputrescine amidase
MRKVVLSATQMACDWNVEENVNKAEKLIREAAKQGANIVLIQELFETPYFPIDQDTRHLGLARPADNHPTITRMAQLARELSVVLPVSFFERSKRVFFNSLALIDADGSLLGIYRKTHIPNTIGYQEKTYFSPGDLGFRAWKTRYGSVGVGICWDQWFPETARCLALNGAEMLFFPTSIGSEPGDAEIDSRDHWQRVMQGHAGANIMPLAASNRIGVEKGDNFEMTFYGSSFIADHTGAKVAEANRIDETVLTATFDLDEIRRYREDWGVFRDRRPARYGALMTLDGESS